MPIGASSNSWRMLAAPSAASYSAMADRSIPQAMASPTSTQTGTTTSADASPTARDGPGTNSRGTT